MLNKIVQINFRADKYNYNLIKKAAKINNETTTNYIRRTLITNSKKIIKKQEEKIK